MSPPSHGRVPGECVCADGWTPHPPALPRVRCSPSPHCAGSVKTPTSHSIPAIFAIVLANRRPSQVTSVLRLKENLRAVNSTLGLAVIIVGFRDTAIEEKLALAAVKLHPMPMPPVPAWAHRTHRLTFSKLLLWNASLAWGRVLIHLDTDMVVVRNIDALQHVPTPAFVLRPKEVVNSGLMVLNVRSARQLDGLWEYYTRIVDSNDTRGDGSDQQVLINYFASTGQVVFELPVEWNVYGWEMSRTTQWWMHVRVIHKLPGLHLLTPAQRGAWDRSVPASATTYLSALARAVSPTRWPKQERAFPASIRPLGRHDGGSFPHRVPLSSMPRLSSSRAQGDFLHSRGKARHGNPPPRACTWASGCCARHIRAIGCRNASLSGPGPG